MEFEDLELDQLVYEDGAGDAGEAEAGKGRKRKKRVRNWTAEDRARHRVFEKGRREAFNERLTELASLIPNLQNAKETQLSKHVIVDESVKFHHVQEARLRELTQRLDDLQKRHEELLQEVSIWREAAQWQASSVGVGVMPDGSGSQAQGNGEPVPIGDTGNVPAGISDYAASQTQRSVLPELGTYPDSLTQLGSDPTTAQGIQRLNGLPDPVAAPDGSAMQRVPENYEAYDPTVAASSHDMQPQQLFGRFRHPGPIEQSHIDSSHPPPTFVTPPEWESVPRNMQDIFRMQWALDQSGNWPPHIIRGEHGWADLQSTMALRSDTAAVNA